MKSRGYWALAFLALSPAASIADQVVSPTWAVGFQDEDLYDVTTTCGQALLTQEATSEVLTQDGVFAPRTEECLLFDFYATGTSTHFLDALALRFEIGSAVAPGSHVYLMFHLKRGNYGNWRSLKLYAGAFNQQDADCDRPECWEQAVMFPDIAYWEGDVPASVPLEWINSDGTVELTTRMWNARIDEVKLIVDEPNEPFECDSMISAIAFEDEYFGCGSAAIQQDAIEELCSLDDRTTPRVEGWVSVDYLATGQSAGYLDALSLVFEIRAEAPPVTLKLMAWIKKGSYSNEGWHAVKLYPGSFNPTEEDCDQPACWAPEDLFPGDPGWQGWVEREIPIEWVSGNRLELTMRVWNARIDVVRLVADRSTPTARSSWGAVRARYR